MLEAAIFRDFPVLMASSLRQALQAHSEICLFCSAIQYIVFKKQTVGSAHEVFDEPHFIVNLHNFLQSLALPRYNFPPSEPFASHPSQAEQFSKLLSFRHIRNSLSVYLFLNSEP